MRLAGSFFFILSIAAAGEQAMAESTEKISLPPPRNESPVSVESALLQRRSIRSFADSPLSPAEIGQRWIGAAPGMVVIAAVPSRTAARYGSRADRYVAMEVGAVVQNIQLQGISLGIGSTFVGAFDDAVLKSLLKLAADEHPLAVVPLGRIRDSGKMVEGHKVEGQKSNFEGRLHTRSLCFLPIPSLLPTFDFPTFDL